MRPTHHATAALLAGLLALTGCRPQPGDPDPGPGPAPDTQLSELIAAEARNLVAALGPQGQPVAVLEARAASGKLYGLLPWLSDQLVHHLARAGVQLVERSRLQAVLTEQRLSLSSLVSDEQAISIGNLVGARSLLVPVVTVLAERVSVSLRLVESERGLILATAQLELPLGMLPADLLVARDPEAGMPEVKLTLLAEQGEGGPLAAHPAGEPLASYSRFKLEVAPDRPLYLYLIAIDAEGRASLLFPGALTGLANPVPAGTYLLPVDSWFVLDEHAGREAMVLLAHRQAREDIEALLRRVQETVAGPPTAPALARLSSALAGSVEVIRAAHWLHR